MVTLENLTAKLSGIIFDGARARMSDLEFLEAEIAKWKFSKTRLMQIAGFRYYEGDHDILKRERMMIGEGGRLEKVDNLPNNRIVDNQYAKLVNQKANYIVGKPFVIESDNENYVKELNLVMGKNFFRLLKSAGKSALNGGIAWLFPYYGEDGSLCFRLFPAYEILPFWKDREHTDLDCAVRLYSVIGYEGKDTKLFEKVEVFDGNGITFFTLNGGKLEADSENPNKPYVTAIGEEGEVTALNWQKIPLVALKYNEAEIPLLKKVKCLQDGLNVMISDFENNMQEDARNTILVLKNYDGTDLGEFRRNLSTFGAVKVRYDGDTKGGVETLEVQINAENYRSILELFKKAIIENGMGYDAKDDRMAGNPNQMNIQSMYSDIDLEANDMETELQATFENLLWFVNAHLANTGKGDFSNEKVSITFNRDMLMNESEVIDNCAKSVGILSNETIVAQHPWVNDVDLEMERLEKQKQDDFEMQTAFMEIKQQEKNNGNKE